MIGFGAQCHCGSFLLLLAALNPTDCFKWENSVYQSVVFANRSGEALFRWKYSLGGALLENLKVACGYLPRNQGQDGMIKLIEKQGHKSRLSRVGSLPGRYGSIETYQEKVKWRTSRSGQIDNSVVGFVIKRAQVSHPKEYLCQAIYELPGKSLGVEYSKPAKSLEVYDPPVLLQCLDNLPDAKEHESLEISCYAAGNPAPSLQCSLLNSMGHALQSIPRQPMMQNISAQRFLKVPREAEDIMCFADGGPFTGTVNITLPLTVHHTPSAPYDVAFIPATNTSSLNIMWSEIRGNETGGEILGYLIEWVDVSQMWVSRSTTDEIEKLTTDLLNRKYRVHDDYFSDYYQYEIHGLNPGVEYKVHVSAYNQWGYGLPWKGSVVPERIPVKAAYATEASVGAIIGGILAGIIFIAVFVFLAVWCSSRSKQDERLPTSLVEDAVDYPQGTGLSVYTTVDKNKNKIRESQRSQRSHNDYPDVLNGTDLRPLVTSNSYEASNKSFV